MKGMYAGLRFLFCALPALSDSVPRSQAIELRSPDGRYAARIEPGSGDAFEFADIAKKEQAMSQRAPTIVAILRLDSILAWELQVVE